MGTRAIHDIASEIESDWRAQKGATRKAHEVYARPYLDAMHSLVAISDNYYADSGYSVVAYFLSNTQTWRGEVARRIKLELKQLLKGGV